MDMNQMCAPGCCIASQVSIEPLRRAGGPATQIEKTLHELAGRLLHRRCDVVLPDLGQVRFGQVPAPGLQQPKARRMRMRTVKTSRPLASQ